MAVSIQLLHIDSIQSEKDKKLNMKNKKTVLKEQCKDMNQIEKEEYKKYQKIIKKKQMKKLKYKIS